MKKEGLFKLIFLVAFFVIFITVSVIGSFGLFKFDGSGDPDSPKIFSADFVETDDGYVFNLVSGRAAYYTRLGAVGVRFNKGEVGAENIIYKHYSSVEKTESGYVASAVVSGDKGSQIKVSDYYAIGDSAIGITRKIEVLAVGEEKGFTTEYPILTQKQEKISDSDWFNPAEFYVSGTHGFITTNARTILSNIDEEAVISSANTSALVLGKYKDGYVTAITDLSHTQQVTTYDDTKGLDNNLIIDGDVSMTGISYANYTDADTYAKQVKLAYCFPTKEQLKADSGVVWRMLPVEDGLSRTVSFSVEIKAEDDFYKTVEDVWRKAYSDLSIVDKRYDQHGVYEVLLDSMQRSYSETQWGGIPEYMTNADHYWPESGFLYRNADIALIMYKAGVRYNNDAYKSAAVKVLSKQIELDKIDTGIMSYDKDNSVYYRVRYEGLATVLETYLYFKDNGISLSGTLSLDNLKNYIKNKAELYKNETSALGVAFFSKLWKYQDEFGVDVSATTLRLLNYIAEENRFFGGYFGSVENQGDNYIGVAEDAMIIFNAYLNAYDVTHSVRYLELAKNCATWLETFNMLTPMNLCLKGDDGTLPFNSAFVGNERFLAYGYNFNNTRHCILDCATVISAVDYQHLYDLTGDRHYLDFAQRLIYNSSIYVNMGDKVGLMDDPLHSSGLGFINEFAGNTSRNPDFPDGGIRGAVHTSNIAWCGYQLLYAYDWLDANTDSELCKMVYEEDRSYDLAKYKLVSYDTAAVGDYNLSPEKAFDGKSDTVWKTNSSFAVVDLNEVCYIGKIKISSAVPSSATVRILLSFDGINYSLLTDMTFDGQTAIATVSAKARYVKVQTDSDERISSVEIFGTPEYYETFSYGATVVSGSGNYGGCIDARNYDTAWTVTGDKTLTLDLGSEKIITQCVLKFEGEWQYEDEAKTRKSYEVPTAHSYKIEISSDGVNYTTYSEETDAVKNVYADEFYAECRYVRLTVSAGTETVKLQDFKVMGCEKI